MVSGLAVQESLLQKTSFKKIKLFLQCEGKKDAYNEDVWQKFKLL